MKSARIAYLALNGCNATARLYDAPLDLARRYQPGYQPAPIHAYASFDAANKALQEFRNEARLSFIDLGYLRPGEIPQKEEAASG